MTSFVAQDIGSIAASRDGILRRRDLDACGLSPRQVRTLVETGVLERLHRDAYRLPGPDGRPSERYAAAVRAVTWSDPSRVLTGPAALSLLGIPILGQPRAIHGGLDARGGSSARSIVSTVAVPPADQRCERRGTIVASPMRAALDTARLHSLVAGVAAADHVLRTRMATAEDLAIVLSTMNRLRGVSRARVCASLATGESESPGESWSAVVMHEGGIPRPERQHVFVDEEGFIGRTDFWWPCSRVVGEFDGRVKYGRANPSGRPPEEVLWGEKLREDRLRATGVRVVRWTTADLRRPTAWLQRLRRDVHRSPDRLTGMSGSR
ncbi:type IV toxin-antitoxin system AbiEi family antitoxin domain-containing protein [Actinotalea fermentans]|uniref:CTP synthase n=1 Tax=Actinotalea fermentans TaxID=43671 RepID=A0A511YVV3_9CELL|nr:type IV toxin-antitoxin system AbiEi family antitoxin domain-containing protein [Actinotalea fermentans]KGM15465.1 hypothetical protein N867_08250 [Actinotalea fermentans ATCC 43279 = JCM 9966 = DSM 3133]GEN79320.1 CTP synthase [Actinotalea fermentans]